MPRFRLTLAYDGTKYFGWQKLPCQPTIESDVETALQKILQHPIQLEAASRTDRGVHAKGQIAAFSTEKEISAAKLHISLNRLLPKDIAVTEVKQVPDTFHPTLESVGKEYRYFLSLSPHLPPWKRFFSWHVPQKLDLAAMETAAQFFIGTHSFKTFTNKKPTETYSCFTRTLFSLKLVPNDEGLEFHLHGDRFLYKMARNLVGTLVSVGKGKLKPQDIPLFLSHGKRLDVGPTAPSAGLFLWKVFY